MLSAYNNPKDIIGNLQKMSQLLKIELNLFHLELRFVLTLHAIQFVRLYNNNRYTLHKSIISKSFYRNQHI